MACIRASRVSDCKLCVQGAHGLQQGSVDFWPKACFLHRLSVSFRQAKPCEAADESLLTMCESNVLMFTVHGLQQGFDDQSDDQSPSQQEMVRLACTQA